MSAFGSPIKWATIRRRISNSSWIQDRIELKRMLQLCSTCLYRMPYKWKDKLHYAEFTQAHGVGDCDGCRHEKLLSIFVSTDDPWFAACEYQARIASAIRKADRAFAVNDRRRIH